MPYLWGSGLVQNWLGLEWIGIGLFDLVGELVWFFDLWDDVGNGG